jgi:DMSO/TMAO reductase YedYZ molybdopterin-dependent catalytic subunit
MSAQLPPGQTEISDFPRWGLPEYVRLWPEVPARPVLALGGDVQTPCEISLDALTALPRQTQVSDFHCVTTWSKRDLRWSGYRMRDFYEQLLVPQARPDPEALFLVMVGLDGYRSSLPLADALAPDVMLADQLDGEPLSVEHGGPIRLVAPAHYGYKSAKHLCRIEVTSEPPDTRGGLVHPRARVAEEERGVGRSGPELRVTYSAALEGMRKYFRSLGRPKG